MTDIDTETVIIGGGQTGVPLARALAAEGRPVILIERAHLGGSCVNFGCTPSKAVIVSARLAADARKAASLGILIPQIEVDFRAVMDRAREIVAQSKNGTGCQLRRLGQSASPHGPCAPGRAGDQGAFWFGLARPSCARSALCSIPVPARRGHPFPGLDQVPLIDAENWINLREPPRACAYAGGSYIALAMSQALRRLGCAVTVLQKADQLAEREDPDMAEVLQAALESDGCEVRLNADVRSIEPTATGVRTHLAHDFVEGTHLFLATGRQPNTDDLGLETRGR